ncbi:MAG: DNA-binding protein [Bacteroidales bacterium]|nr:DNA-binding protein [Bacteroidales bacterium]HPO65273.1 DNA-binding protein [Bacteroidales bacterium]
MAMTFNELRRIKDSLPSGSMRRIAERLNLDEDTVRNFFGGTHYRNGEGKTVGVHIEQGPDGGIVTFDDDTILKVALEILEEEKQKAD